ncbi:hypothetical protein D3C77_565280 [compost metagenome]
MLGKLLQQLPLGLNLGGGAALVLLLQVHDAVVANLATTIEQTPLGVEDRWLICAGVQASDRQQDLHIRCETSIARCQHHALAI